MQYIKFSEASLFSLDFNQLTEGYEDYETYIFDSISNVAIMFMEKLGAEIQGDLFLLDDLHYSFKVLFDNVDRIVTISLIPVEAVAKRDFEKKEIKINELGRIKSILIYSHNKYFDSLLNLSINLSKLIKRKYLNYEQAFIEKYEHSNNQLTNGLHEIINTSIILSNKNNLIDNFYISVTKLATSINSNSYYGFSLNRKSLPKLITTLKSNQVNNYSPLDFLIHLVTSDVFDEGISLYKEGIYTSGLKFDEMKTKKLENFKFWLAEKLMYNYSEANAFYYFVQEKDYLLSCDHSMQFHDDIKHVLDEVKKDLEEQFKINLLKSKVGSKKPKVKKEHFYKFLRELFIDFTAKYSAEMSK